MNVKPTIITVLLLLLLLNTVTKMKAETSDREPNGHSRSNTLIKLS
jgi:hypothetical protein